jgi:hypothetical protein
MVDDDDDTGAKGGGVPSEMHVSIQPPADDPVDETEMTSIMGPEERRVLLDAARDVADAAPPQEVVREEDFARPTARPPGAVSDPTTVVLPPAPGVPRFDEAGRSKPARPQQGAPEASARIWALGAFVALAAAVAYALLS